MKEPPPEYNWTVWCKCTPRLQLRSFPCPRVGCSAAGGRKENLVLKNGVLLGINWLIKLCDSESGDCAVLISRIILVYLPPKATKQIQNFRVCLLQSELLLDLVFTAYIIHDFMCVGWQQAPLLCLEINSLAHQMGSAFPVRCTAVGGFYKRDVIRFIDMWRGSYTVLCTAWIRIRPQADAWRLIRDKRSIY